MKRHKILASVAAAAVALGVGGCAKSKDEAATTTKADASTTRAAAGIEVGDPWARATIGEATSTGVFMTLDNTGADDDALVGASAPATVARVVQIHETVASTGDTTTSMQHGGSSMGGGSMGSGQMGSGQMAGMQEVQRVAIPAGGSVQLAPGGYHVMLIDLAKPLAVGDTFELTLEFEKAGAKTVTVTAQES
ncbi:MAG: copper chaperone PCu(A)C [Acidimicrobiia bacterium]